MQPTAIQMSHVPAGGMSIQQPVNVGRAENFSVLAGKVTGIVQIICGLVAIAPAVVLWTYRYYTLSGTISVGLWSGILFLIPTGIIGICCKSKTICIISAYMMMSIFSGVAAAVMIILPAIDISWCVWGYWYWYPGGFSECVGLFSGLLSIGLVEMITSITAIVYCCRGVCPCCPPQNTPMVQTVTPLIVPSQAVIGFQTAPSIQPYHYVITSPPQYSFMSASGVNPIDVGNNTDRNLAEGHDTAQNTTSQEQP